MKILVKVDDDSTEFFDATNVGTDEEGKLIITRCVNKEKDIWKTIGIFREWKYVRYIPTV